MTEIKTPENAQTDKQQAVDQTTSADDTPAAMTVASIVDAHHETHPEFDPATHAANPDGSPKRNADGSIAKKRGRKAGAARPLPPKSAAGVTAQASQGQEEAPDQSARIAPDEAARQSANLVINAAVLLCGEQIGVPKDKDEANGLLFSFKNYYEARGVPNIPPEIGLCLAVSSYIVPRVRASEPAKNKIQQMIGYVKAKFENLRGG